MNLPIVVARRSFPRRAVGFLGKGSFVFRQRRRCDSSRRSRMTPWAIERIPKPASSAAGRGWPGRGLMRKEPTAALTMPPTLLMRLVRPWQTPGSTRPNDHRTVKEVAKSLGLKPCDDRYVVGAAAVHQWGSHHAHCPGLALNQMLRLGSGPSRTETLVSGSGQDPRPESTFWDTL